MFFLDDEKRELVEKILHYTQNEGLVDQEIAKILGLNRVTVTRTRLKYDIPSANLKRRKDKKCVCKYCGKEYYIRRYQKRKPYCGACYDHYLEERRASIRFARKVKEKKEKEREAHKEGER